MEALIPLIIQLASGALGGNIAGSLLNKFSLGTLGNSLVGILGGGLGGQLLGLLGISTGAGSMDVAGIIGSIASGGVGGGVLMALIGVIRQAFNK
ncbi:MAG: GlsB/YeaQ/YmgE family stress response membrane protein [Sedimenticola sp.]